MVEKLKNRVVRARKAPKIKVTAKGFKRSQKEWEESFMGHTGKFIDRLGIDGLLTIGCAYAGYKTFGTWEWALAGAVGYKLARTFGGGGVIGIHSPFFGVDVPFNSQAAGLAILSMIGIKGIIDMYPGGILPERYDPSKELKVVYNEKDVNKLTLEGWKCQKHPSYNMWSCQKRSE